MQSRILIIEDDPLQQAVLRSALQCRGYEVDVASDGLSGLRMLRTGCFDLAIIDYQLPEIDGFASARLLCDMVPKDDRPKLIAVTAACDSLITREMSDNVFDAILSKPLDLPGLLTMVSTQLRATPARLTTQMAQANWRALGLPDAPAVITLPLPTPIQAQLLRCYFDLNGTREPEAVLLLGPDSGDDAVEARTRQAHFCLPFISLGGAHLGADALFSAADLASWGKVATAITQFGDRRRTLARSAAQALDLETRLLAYVFLSGRPFAPALGFANRECARYPGFFPDADARLAAEKLADRGLLDRTFVERFHSCASCGSSRLNVREECPSCDSANLRDVPLIHHFRCAHQAPESDFIRGPRLVCPKCRQQLRHYGSDYDKPGTGTQCLSCSAISPEPTVGFTCLDCSAHTGGDAATKRDVFSYSLTPDGAALLRRGTARLTEHSPLPITRVPRVILEALAVPGPISALAEIRYGARAHILARRGEAGFEAMRRLFLENLVNALEGDCVLASGPEADHLLIRSAAPGVLAEIGPDLLEACQEMLSEGLEPELRLLAIPPRAATLQ